MYENYKENFEKLCNEEFEKQINIALINNIDSYYDIFKIKRSGIRHYLSIISKLLGYKNFHRIIYLATKIKGTLVKG